ncbi:MAG TPA: tRNA dimethylallyltransferase, partial [Chthoniobacterales bacterium]
EGVVEEVRRIGETGGTAAKAIGLAEIRQLIEGSLTPAECRERIVNATRQYAKRQLTWFRAQASYTSIPLTQLEPITHSLGQALRLTHD